MSQGDHSKLRSRRAMRDAMLRQRPTSKARLGVLARRVLVNPVFASGGYQQLRSTLGLHLQCVQSGRGSCRAETQCIVVGHVVRQRDETCLQILGIVEVKELASGEL